MGFTVRFMLGAVLVLSCCWSSETTFRYIRQVHNNGESEDERITQGSVVANLTEESNKPKTDPSTEDNRSIEKQNSISKLQKFESYKKATGQPEIKNVRDDTARSIDIEKYVSKEFHNKNNVYTVSISPDNAKYIDSEYSYHPTIRHSEDYTKEFHFNSELTTPKHTFFDHKYKEAVESVEQKLEHIDDSHELSLESESRENLNLEKLYEETLNNDTKANLSYVNFKNIISNNTSGKNDIHKDLVVEAGTNLDFRSSYNETVITDDDDKGNSTTAKESKEKENVSTATPTKLHSNDDQDRSESSTSKSIILTTRKSIILTKPPSNKNTSHISILSNNIETETVKAINPTQVNSSPTTEKPKGELEKVEEYTLKSPIEVVKRGRTKSINYTSTEAPVIANEIRKKSEPLHQENQVSSVHLQAPPTTVYPERLIDTTTLATTVEEHTPTSTVNDVTTTETISVESETKLTLTTEAIPETTLLTETTTELPQLENTTLTSVNLATTTATTMKDMETTTESATTDILPTTTVTVTEPITIKEDNFSSVNLDNDSTTTTVESTTNDVISANESEKNIETPVNGSVSNRDFDKNISMTTENIMRTSKGIVFRETVPTTELPLTTTEIALTTEPLESTTEILTTIAFRIHETQSDEQPSVATVTETNFVASENRTNSTSEAKPDPNDMTTEVENTTDGSSLNSDSFNTIPPDDNSGTIAAITISSIGAICLILLAGLLVIMRKRQKRFNYGQRCTPVSLGHYSIDNVSTCSSVRRKGEVRDSKRSYRNPAFEDPAAISHPLNFPALGKFVNNVEDMKAEFEEIPQITARTNELPEGCDIKNRYANVIPLPETRVPLNYIDGYPNSDYINANYVTGPKNIKGYYIACQAPMQNTVDDFWRMVWEQQSKVILMITHLYENGVEKCFDYLPPSEVLDCHRAFGDFLVTLKKREVKDKYIISTLQLKNMVSSSWREVTHFWYMGWPEKGVPSEANSLIAFLIEARSYMKSSSLDRKNVTNSNLNNGTTKNELNPVVVHCSPGTGRTGVVIACDIAIREFEQTRLVDIPRIVYKIRRDRASAVQTKEQYAFIYKVVNLYATKLTGDALDSF